MKTRFNNEKVMPTKIMSIQKASSAKAQVTEVEKEFLQLTIIRADEGTQPMNSAKVKPISEIN